VERGGGDDPLTKPSPLNSHFQACGRKEQGSGGNLPAIFPLPTSHVTKILSTKHKKQTLTITTFNVTKI
jgi:hypothetical protein